MSPRKLQPLLILGLILLFGGCSIFGKPSVCTERHQGSFATFLDEEWVEYCQEYKDHVQNTANYNMKELTSFFSDHPRRVEELNKTLVRFDKYESCFKSPKEELELRELRSCLQDDDQTDLEIANAWLSQAEPWVKDLEFRVADIQPPINDAEREADRQLRKAAEAFDFKAKMDEAPYQSFAALVAEIDTKLKEVEGVDDEYRTFVQLAKGHKSLTETMADQIGPQINAIAADAQSLRERWRALDEARRYLEFAVNSAGVRCPKGQARAREEMRIAKRIVSGKNKEVGGSGIRIASTIEAEAQGPIDYERFEGFVCGVRQPDNQFPELNRLCGQYQFVIERQKGSNVDDWESWVLKSFTESGPSGGVDCSLMK